MSALKATATISAAIALALLTVQGTLALWTATATSKSQTVKSADFKVTVAVGGTVQRVPASGTVTVANLSDLKPGAKHVTPIKVTNATDAGGTFTIRATAEDLVATGKLAQYLDTGITRATDGSCNEAQQDNVLDLAKGASGTFCLNTTLKVNAPATVSGAEASVAFTLASQQLEHK